MAEALKRSFVNEGITRAKALEMKISKTIDVCRANTRSTTAKLVIESANYTNSNNVLSNFAIQNDKAKKEKDAFDLELLKKKNKQINQNQNQNFRGKRGNFRGRGRGFQNRKFDSNNGRNGQKNQNSQHNRGGFRCRGRGSYHNSSNRNEHTIRFVQGNDGAPS